MTINLFQAVISEESIQAVSEVLRSGWIGLGPKTKEFEDEFSKYINTKYTIGLNSCTSALHLAMELIDIQEGDEVLTTALTFVSTNHAILYKKGTPVFVDIQPNTLNIDPEDIKRKITSRTKAIICVHYAGYPCDLDEIHKIAKENNLMVIEDCAHACGASYKGKKIGSISDINCFSFHAVKNLPMGDGGAITTNNSSYNERLNKLRWLGIDKSTFNRTESESEKNINVRAYAWRYNVEELGYKYHLNDINASIGIEELKKLDVANDRRREIGNMYRNGLKNIEDLELLEYKDDRITSQHIFCIKVDKRTELISKLKENDIHPGVHYYRNDFYSLFKKADLPKLELVHDKLLSLPLHLALSNDEVEKVIEVIKKDW